MLRTEIHRRVATACTLLAVALAGCDDDDGLESGEASVRVMMTDAPSDFMSEAQVDIGAIALIDMDGEAVVLTDDATDGFVNLLELQGTAAATLADLEVDVAAYERLELVVEEAEITLASGYEFSDQTVTKVLQIPAGAQAGIELDLSSADGDAEGGIEVDGGETVLIVDFDVNQSFLLQGDPLAAAGLTGVLLEPNLRVVANDVAGEVSGTVTTAEQGLDLEGLIVVAEADAEGSLEAYQTLTATAVTDAQGQFEIRFVVPGDYTVSVLTPEGYTTAEASVTVAPSGAVTGADFEIVSN